jgi:ribonuclease Z
VVPALGFRVEQDGRSVVLSGDTKRCDTLVQAAKGADMLVSEALNTGMMQARIDFLRANKNERMALILEEAMDYHTPTLDVAAMAAEAGVAQLVLTHLIPPIPDDGPQFEAFAAGMADVYTGPITIARDLQKLTLG